MRLNKKLFYIIMVLLLLAGAYAGLKNWTVVSNDAISSNEALPNPNISDLLSSANFTQPAEKISAPDFSLTSLEGDKSSLSQYKGNVVLISFWATW